MARLGGAGFGVRGQGVARIGVVWTVLQGLGLARSCTAGLGMDGRSAARLLFFLKITKAVVISQSE